MPYQETLDYLYSRLPMFQNIGAAAYKANLDNTYKISELLGKPHLKNLDGYTKFDLKIFNKIL
jgi:dihydrofolate synthase/folylpolyglutamate synthase